MTAAQPNPLSTLRISRYHIPTRGSFPNSTPTDRPLIIYHSAFPTSSTSRDISAHLRSVGVVEPQWTFPMYKEHHYHSTTHEVLVVHSGSAILLFGGPRDADPSEKMGQEQMVKVQVEKGDVMVVPAGMSHAMESGEGFSMIGSYPVGAAQWDHQVGEIGEEGWERMRGLEWFEWDPVYGDDTSVISER